MNTLNVWTPSFRRALSACVLASALVAMPAIAQSDANGMVAADNTIDLFSRGDDNQVTLEQVGELNSLNLLIQAHNVSANIFQNGSTNLVAGVNGAPALTITGQNSVVDIMQSGQNNQVFAAQMSANSTMSITQLGNGNIATITQR